MIIFDCDGVLVDSEIISNQVDSDLFATIGYAISPNQMISRFIGMTKRAIWEIVAREHGVVFPEALFAQANAMILARYETDLQAVPGVANAVRAVGVARAVASSSEMSKLRLALQVTGLLPLFDPSVFSASQVARGKPAPDVFLYAAAQCGAALQDCIVVEDSPAGVQAGLAAGMRVIGFTGGAHSYPGHDARLLAEGATVVIPHMDALAETVAGLRKV
jgi:HAD superfamily hydrolase (TIGR01509 family)